MAEAPADPTLETIVMWNDKVRVFKHNKNRRRAPKGMGWDFSFRLRSDAPLHKRSPTMSAWTVDAVVGGARAVATSGEKEKIVGGRQRVSLDTAQPCKNVRAAGEQLSRSPVCHWPRAHAEFSEWRGW